MSLRCDDCGRRTRRPAIDIGLLVFCTRCCERHGLEAGEHGEVHTYAEWRAMAERAQNDEGTAVSERTIETERFLELIRAVARGCGCAIAVHGSEARDLDLVAVPWAVEAIDAQALVDALCEEAGLVICHSPWPCVPSPEAKPWGRLGWTLHGCPDHKYVDLSVAPRTGEAVPIPLRIPHVIEERGER